MSGEQGDEKSATHAFETVCLHGGKLVDGNRAHITPIYTSSTYTFDSAESAAEIVRAASSGEKDNFLYGRWGNPTVAEAENRIALLESHDIVTPDGEPLVLEAVLHPSGMAAFTTMMLNCVQAGDFVLAPLAVYGGCSEVMQNILTKYGVSTVTVDYADLNAVENVLMEGKMKARNFKHMHMETPANPTLQCSDLEALSNLAKKFGMTVSVDSTFATPYLQQPFKYQVDYVMHSTTKFLNGHGTAVGGVIVGRDMKSHRGLMKALGTCANAFDAYQLVNGMRTLVLRMERHCSNAAKIALFLNAHDSIETVNYPGLSSHPSHAIAQKQMKNGGSMMSFELKGGKTAGALFINSLKLCVHAVSLGTCDTLISHPASTTHAQVPKEKRVSAGITDGLVRMSVGIEHVDDIIADITQALAKASS